MKAYFLSGLGADRRAFWKIKLPHGYEPIYLDWIEPEPNESLPHYASRLANFIDDNSQFILVGLSFGGMIASEIAKIKKPIKIIIISSIACSNELPWYFQRAGKIGLHKVIPVRFFKAGTFLRRLISVGTPEDKAIVYEYVNQVDPGFLRWSLNAIINWRHHDRIPDLVHIHGTKDHLLPSKYIHADYTVEKAGHLMVFNRSEEVNSIIAEVLNRET